MASAAIPGVFPPVCREGRRLVDGGIAEQAAIHHAIAKLKVLPPLCPLKVSAADFSRADELIARARTATGSWIDAGGPDLPTPQRFLSMHDHKNPGAIARQDVDRANERRTASSPH